jgi:hypothetical protein
MNINKKLDRVKQWAGEKMGAESKTGVSEEFKALEIEMSLRHDGQYTKCFLKVVIIMLTLSRHGSPSQVDDWLRQVNVEAQRSRRQREDLASSISRPDNDEPWRRLRTRFRVWKLSHQSVLALAVLWCILLILAGMGRINERVARIQETYMAHATTTWLESLERSLAQMKEYQV